MRYLRSTLVDAHNALTRLFVGFWGVAAQEVRAAFEVLGNARRLAAIFETFIGLLDDDRFNVRRKLTRVVAEDMRTQQHLITHDVDHHMSRYEVCSPRRDPVDVNSEDLMIPVGDF